MQNKKTPLKYKTNPQRARAATKMPAAPPTNPITPVGIVLPSTPPVLFTSAPVVVVLANPGVVLALTIAIVPIAPRLLNSLGPISLVVIVGAPSAVPFLVSVQVIVAFANCPFQLQPPSIVKRPGVESVRWNCQVSGPCMRV